MKLWKPSLLAVLMSPGVALAQLGPIELPPLDEEGAVSRLEAAVEGDEMECVVVTRYVNGVGRVTFDSCDVTDQLPVANAEGVAYYRDGESHQVEQILSSNLHYGASHGQRYRLVVTSLIDFGSEEGLPIIGGGGPTPGPIQCEIDGVTQEVR